MKKPILLITGPQASGKTQLAKSYANDYPAEDVLWVFSYEQLPLMQSLMPYSKRLVIYDGSLTLRKGINPVEDLLRLSRVRPGLRIIITTNMKSPPPELLESSLVERVQLVPTEPTVTTHLYDRQPDADDQADFDHWDEKEVPHD